jgi:hypothetical protein
MNKKEAQYCGSFFLTLIGGLILIILCSAGILLMSQDNSHGNYGASEADTLVVMLIVTGIAILAWFIGISHYFNRWCIARENKQIPHECKNCDKIIMIPEIDVVEETIDHYLKCPTCNHYIWRR